MKIVRTEFISSDNLDSLIKKPDWSIYEPSLNEIRGFIHRGVAAFAVYSSGDSSFSNSQVFDGKPHFGAIDIITYEARPKYEGEGNINVYHSIFVPVKNPRNGYDYWSYTFASGARVPHYPSCLESVISIYDQAFLDGQVSDYTGQAPDSFLWRPLEVDPTTSLDGGGKTPIPGDMNQFRLDSPPLPPTFYSTAQNQ